VTIAKGAKNEDPDCPSHSCILWLNYPQWDVTWGIAGPQVQRFYLSDVSYGGQNHLFIAVVYPNDPRDMTSSCHTPKNSSQLCKYPRLPADHRGLTALSRPIAHLDQATWPTVRRASW
jgi:hypothetical protein